MPIFNWIQQTNFCIPNETFSKSTKIPLCATTDNKERLASSKASSKISQIFIVTYRGKVIDLSLSLVKTTAFDIRTCTLACINDLVIIPPIQLRQIQRLLLFLMIVTTFYTCIQEISCSVQLIKSEILVILWPGRRN